MAKARKAAAKQPAASKETKERQDIAKELTTQQEEAAAGQTDAQKEMREYHEGEFQTHDPITHEPRDLDERPIAARMDRGESVEDVVRQRREKK